MQAGEGRKYSNYRQKNVCWTLSVQTQFASRKRYLNKCLLNTSVNNLQSVSMMQDTEKEKGQEVN